jgi:hypothetical protein
MTLTLPIRITSGLNMREHWRVRAARVKRERTIACLAAFGCVGFTSVGWPAVCTLTRIAPGLLDDDNLAGGFKAVRDGIADALGIDDADPRITWRYAQQKGPRGEYKAIVTLEKA